MACRNGPAQDSIHKNLGKKKKKEKLGDKMKENEKALRKTQLEIWYIYYSSPLSKNVKKKKKKILSFLFLFPFWNLSVHTVPFLSCVKEQNVGSWNEADVLPFSSLDYCLYYLVFFTFHPSSKVNYRVMGQFEL